VEVTRCDKHSSLLGAVSKNGLVEVDRHWQTL